MDISNNTVLITGGASGIGFALAERFSKAGSRVIICGRREKMLAEAENKCPELNTLTCDVSLEEERLELYRRVSEEFPQLNILINNAGIQNRLLPVLYPQDWKKHRFEIATNLEAPMHLSFLFTPILQKQNNAAIINNNIWTSFCAAGFHADLLCN